MNYRHEIDGLRAVAVLAVIVTHTGLGWLPGGYAGVDVFFVISGFLITSLIIRDLDEGCFNFREFYIRRARRILPALFLMLSVTTVVGWALLSPSEIRDLSGSVFFSVLFLSNGYFLDFTDYFAPSAHYIPLLHTWSLAIEEQFYLLFPIIAFFTYRRFGITGLWVIVLVLTVASFALSEWGWRNKPRTNYFFSPSRFWEILLGSIAALWSIRRSSEPNGPLAALGLGAIFLSFLVFDEATPFPSAYTLVPTLGTVLVLLNCGAGSGVAWLLCWTPIRIVGLFSFSAYLWHQPTFALARILGYDPAIPLTALILIAGVMVISVLSWAYVEQPFRQIPTKSALSRDWRTVLLSACAAALIAASLAGYFTRLPLLRFNPTDQRLLEVTRIDANRYQRRIGRPYERRTFNNDGSAPMVAFVGDSFARDFLNILNEAAVLPHLDVSLWTIGHTCAPFYLTPEQDQDLSHIWDAAQCNGVDRYQSPEMLAALAAADVIVLASAWQDWHGPYVNQSVANLRRLTEANIVLVGPKDFGTVSTRELLEMPPGTRVEHRIQVHNRLLDANSDMGRIEGIAYLDLISLFCSADGRCPQVLDDGLLISQDGRHLTQAGAIQLGILLEREMQLSNLFVRRTR